MPGCPPPCPLKRKTGRSGSWSTTPVSYAAPGAAPARNASSPATGSSDVTTSRWRKWRRPSAAVTSRSTGAAAGPRTSRSRNARAYTTSASRLAPDSGSRGSACEETFRRRSASRTAGACSRITCALVPPIPMECTPARRTSPGTGHAVSRAGSTNGLDSTASAGFGARKFTSGGTMPCRSTRTALISPARPAALSRCPMAGLVEPSAQNPVRSVWRRNASVRAANSIGSPLNVPVPCAST